ncbi:hypothetical protein B0H11DRAFT_2405808 [Mycena galericulata]|nr:hypothetical protein B0H11DRAFT_2405808 [Mycena galericulata]
MTLVDLEPLDATPDEDEDGENDEDDEDDEDDENEDDEDSEEDNRESLRAATRARDGHGRGIHGQSTARPVLYTAVRGISSPPTGRHGSRHGRNGDDEDDDEDEDEVVIVPLKRKRGKGKKSNGEKGKETPEPTAPPPREITYTICIFTPEQLKKSKSSRGPPATDIVKLYSDAPWDTLRARIINNIMTSLDPPTLDFAHYNVIFTVPRQVSDPIPLNNTEKYEHLVTNALNIKKNPCAKIVVEPKPEAAEKENNATPGGDKAPKRNTTKVRNERDILPANAALNEKIAALRPRDDSGLPETQRPLKYRSLELFIQNMRVQPPNQFMQSIVVPSAGDLDTGEWLVNGNELIRAIQNSPSSLDGAQKLAFNDLMQPGWKRYFVKILGSEILEEESTSSPQFTVPADSRLEIVVEDSVPPTTSSGSEATTASPAASPSGSDLHTDMSNSPEEGNLGATIDELFVPKDLLFPLKPQCHLGKFILEVWGPEHGYNSAWHFSVLINMSPREFTHRTNKHAHHGSGQPLRRLMSHVVYSNSRDFLCARFISKFTRRLLVSERQGDVYLSMWPVPKETPMHPT